MSKAKLESVSVCLEIELQFLLENYSLQLSVCVHISSIICKVGLGTGRYKFTMKLFSFDLMGVHLNFYYKFRKHCTSSTQL